MDTIYYVYVVFLFAHSHCFGENIEIFWLGVEFRHEMFVGVTWSEKKKVNGLGNYRKKKMEKAAKRKRTSEFINASNRKRKATNEMN